MAEILIEPSDTLEEPGLHVPWQDRREQFRANLQEQQPPGIGTDELTAHFEGMPAHYWERLTHADLFWGLTTIHGFLKLVAAPDVPPTTPLIDWQPGNETSHTRIMLCTWDRHGLLAKAAAALSAVRLNILEADVFTRQDNVVLDVFCVTDAERRAPANPARLEELKFLIEGALSQPPRFASVWACSRHKYLAAPSHFKPRIVFENDSLASATVLRVQASDRVGLLYDILQTIADSGLNITQARVETVANMAQDIFHLTDENGQKINEVLRMDELKRRLEAALTVID